MKKALLVLGFFTAFVTYAPTQEMSVISGKLLGHDGKPMRKAHVHLSHDSYLARTPLQSIEVAKDGSFEIRFNETGVRQLNFTGVNHYAHTVALLIEEPLHAKLDVRLKPYEYVEDFGEVKIIGDFNNFSTRSPRPMRRQKNGAFVFEMEMSASTFAYQILGVEKSGLIAINGTQSDDFVYDGNTVDPFRYDVGGYHSMVKVSDGKIKIVFDPTKLLHAKSDEKAIVQFESATSLLEKFYTLDREWQQSVNKRDIAIKAYQDAHPGDRTLSGFSYDWSDDLTKRAEQIASEKDAIVRQMLLAQYLRFGMVLGVREKLDKKLIAQALAEIPATSHLWEVDRQILAFVVFLTGEKEKYENYVNQALEHHPDRYVRANILEAKLDEAADNNDSSQVRILFTRYMDEFGDLDIAKYAKKHYAPEKAITKGEKVPAFSVTSMDAPGVVYTNDSLKGKAYLIDFWGTWCAPCIREMPYLHAAYEKFKGKGFTILSLTCDAAPDDVIKFRQGEWKMPWLHGFLPGCFTERKNDLVEKFEITHYPTAILVGPDQRILATEQELRGEKLEATLSRVFSQELSQKKL